MNLAIQDRREILQAKKQDVVRETIWNAAIDLFHEHGFDSVTADQIADAAGVSRRTFFRYYSSKEDVMASTTRIFGAGLIEAIGAAENGLSGIEVARAAIKTVLAPHLSQAERVMQIADRSRAARMAQFLEVPILERDLAAAFAKRDRGERASMLQHRMLASFALTATGLCVEIWVANQNRSIDQIVDEIFAAMLEVCQPGQPAHA